MAETEPRAAELTLYAIIHASDGGPFARTRRPSLVEACGLAALVGRPSTRGDVAARALAHDAIVRRAVEVCSSVIPFRYGVTLPSREAVARLLEQSHAGLLRTLSRFRRRVEVGVKVRLPSAEADARLGASLAGVRALCPSPADRRERVREAGGRRVFDGAYLILRDDVEGFWSAVAEARRREPSFPMLSMGPWAPYSFCAPLAGEGLS